MRRGAHRAPPLDALVLGVGLAGSTGDQLLGVDGDPSLASIDALNGDRIYEWRLDGLPVGGYDLPGWPFSSQALGTSGSPA